MTDNERYNQLRVNLKIMVDDEKENPWILEDEEFEW